MLAHQWYDANFDDELKEDRLQAKELCFEYNHTRPSNVEKRNEIMEKLFGYKLENVGFQSRLIQIMDGILSSEKCIY